MWPTRGGPTRIGAVGEPRPTGHSVPPLVRHARQGSACEPRYVAKSIPTAAVSNRRLLGQRAESASDRSRVATDENATECPTTQSFRAGTSRPRPSPISAPARTRPTMHVVCASSLPWTKKPDRAYFPGSVTRWIVDAYHAFPPAAVGTPWRLNDSAIPLRLMCAASNSHIVSVTASRHLSLVHSQMNGGRSSTARTSRRVPSVSGCGLSRVRRVFGSGFQRRLEVLQVGIPRVGVASCLTDNHSTTRFLLPDSARIARLGALSDDPRSHIRSFRFACCENRASCSTLPRRQLDCRPSPCPWPARSPPETASPQPCPAPASRSSRSPRRCRWRRQEPRLRRRPLPTRCQRTPSPAPGHGAHPRLHRQRSQRPRRHPSWHRHARGGSPQHLHRS